MATLTIVLSVLALAVSIWTRIEAFIVGRQQRRSDLTKRAGEAFVAIQLAKNALSDSLDELRRVLDGAPDRASAEYLAAVERLSHFERDYETSTSLVGGFEELLRRIENGGMISVDPCVVEAKIARANQLKILADFDLQYLRSDVFRRRIVH